MSLDHKIASRLHLAETNCSIDIDQSDRQSKIEWKKNGKKRIGRYSFYLKHLIGSGYSSKVYKGIKENNKGEWFAIKVIKIKDMNVANIYLLNSQIDIIQQLVHPNLVKFVEVLYTNNHCYLITEYCQGGTLERYIKNNEAVEWGSITHQITQGCQYLTNSSIVHRDLKPANIFLKDGLWKIGDFGFSKKIPNQNSLIIQNFKVGSPLFMPIETFERNMYSLKSDSFALGVIIYYLIFRQYPWNGNSLNKLLKNYKQKQLDCSRLELYPLQVTSIIKGLLNMNMKQRLLISNCNFDIFLKQKSIKQIDSSLLKMKTKITEQVVLCQFINYLIKNSMIFLEDDHILYTLMSNNLYHLTNIFKWDDNKCLKQMKSQYILPEGSIRVTQQNYRKILKSLESTINLKKFREDDIIYRVATEKMLQYYFITKCILEADIQKLSSFLKSIVLHKNYNDLIPNNNRIEELIIVAFGNQ